MEATVATLDNKHIKRLALRKQSEVFIVITNYYFKLFMVENR
jgi:hypothetical protein